MDPKTPANLDPKLKEIYERVMGTNTTPIAPSSATPPSSSTPPVPAAAPATPMTASQPTTPLEPPHAIPVSMPTAQPATPATAEGLPPLPTSPSAPLQPATPLTPVHESHPATATPVSPTPSLTHEMHSPTPAPAAAHEETKQVKKSSSFMKIFLILTGVLFLAVYAVFWMKYFNIPLPFLS